MAWPFPPFKRWLWKGVILLSYVYFISNSLDSSLGINNWTNLRSGNSPSGTFTSAMLPDLLHPQEPWALPDWKSPHIRHRPWHWHIPLTISWPPFSRCLWASLWGCWEAGCGWDILHQGSLADSLTDWSTIHNSLEHRFEGSERAPHKYGRYVMGWHLRASDQWCGKSRFWRKWREEWHEYRGYHECEWSELSWTSCTKNLNCIWLVCRTVTLDRKELVQLCVGFTWVMLCTTIG